MLTNVLLMSREVVMCDQQTGDADRAINIVLRPSAITYRPRWLR